MHASVNQGCPLFVGRARERLWILTLPVAVITGRKITWALLGSLRLERKWHGHSDSPGAPRPQGKVISCPIMDKEPWGGSHEPLADPDGLSRLGALRIFDSSNDCRKSLVPLRSIPTTPADGV